MWSYTGAFFDAVQNVLQLKLPAFEKYKAWEDCIKHGSFRVMHEEFCIVCDFPEIIKIDDQNRPHCENGPSHRWRDGWELYHWHGVKVPEAWINSPESISVKDIIREENLDLRAAGFQIMGWPRVLEALDAVEVDADPDPMIGVLYEVALPGLTGKHLFARYECPRNGTMAQPVPPNSIDGQPIKTILAAKARLAGKIETDYMPPEIRT